MDEFGLSSRIAGPVQICRPGHDLAKPGEYARLQEALYARSAATRIDFFPEAEHGFHYKQDKPANRAAAAMAWPATLAMLGSTLL